MLFFIVCFKIQRTSGGHFIFSAALARAVDRNVANKPLSTRKLQFLEVIKAFLFPLAKAFFSFWNLRQLLKGSGILIQGSPGCREPIVFDHQRACCLVDKDKTTNHTLQTAVQRTWHLTGPDHPFLARAAGSRVPSAPRFRSYSCTREITKTRVCYFYINNSSASFNKRFEPWLYLGAITVILLSVVNIW